MKIWIKIYRSVLMLFCVGLVSGCGSEVSILKESQDESLDPSVNEENTEEKDSQEEKSQEDISKEEQVSYIYIDLCGAVVHPGVYILPAGSRVFQLVEMAGGFLENAYTRSLNQADVLVDGEQIYVYTIEEAAEWQSLEPPDENTALSDLDNVNRDGKVNLNRADKSSLMTLEGIGETRAEAIIRYRDAHGGFSAIEELMQVEGIKERTYEKIKDCITVQ